MNTLNVVMSFPFPVLIVDPNRKLVCANDKVREMFPRASEGVDLALVTRDPALLDVVRRTLSHNKAGECELRIGHSPARTFKAYASPIVSAHDKRAVDGVTLSFIEITDSLEAERMYAAFVANVSHELRSPLTTLISAVDTLTGPAADDPSATKRFLNLMMRESQRMKRLIDDLLSLSALEVKQKEVPTADVDLSESLKRTVEILSPQAEQAGITFETDITATCCLVKGERDELIQVFRNLIENAMKYGDPEQGVSVKLAMDNNHALIDILNWGEPIANEHLPRLTQRFYRIDSHRSREQGGTGLGLSIVKYILNRHKATLKIRSSHEEGTLFRIRIPCV